MYGTIRIAIFIYKRMPHIFSSSNKSGLALLITPKTETVTELSTIPANICVATIATNPVFNGTTPEMASSIAQKMDADNIDKKAANPEPNSIFLEKGL